jgi:hypothetical protein
VEQRISEIAAEFGAIKGGRTFLLCLIKESTGPEFFSPLGCKMPNTKRKSNTSPSGSLTKIAKQRQAYHQKEHEKFEQQLRAIRANRAIRYKMHKLGINSKK